MKEAREPGAIPIWRHPAWAERFPWLVQGTTGIGEEAEPFDLGLYGGQPAGQALANWRALRRTIAMATAVHARQVHSSIVHHHLESLPSGLVLMEGFDGHITNHRGVLLSVSVADCVPVSLVDARLCVVAMLHAGWRGAAGGILEAGIEMMRTEYGSRLADVWMHCGPAICGECYEVGADVHRAVNPRRPPPNSPVAIDLRAALTERALGCGVPAAHCTVSAHCTLCGPGAFFSHRGGRAERQMGVLGIR